jgi:tRNA threonylcarbamoyladenosine biosynthesis protein TsaE
MRGFAKGLGARGRVASPTFIIIRRMRITNGPFTNLFHMDAYRLSSDANVRALGIRGALRDPQSVLAIEWPDALRRALPRRALTVRFAHGRTSAERRINLPRQLT